MIEFPEEANEPFCNLFIDMNARAGDNRILSASVVGNEYCNSDSKKTQREIMSDQI